RPRSAVTDTAKPLPAGGKMSFDYGDGAFAQPHVHCANDAGRGAKIAVAAAGTFGSNALDKLRLADNSELFRTIGAIHRSTFNKNRLTDVVTFDVCREVFQKISMRFAVRCIPEVMMGIDDRQLRL